MQELDFQTLLIETVKREGGYGRKISHRFIRGIPDLLLRVPGLRGLVLAEVKIIHLPGDKIPFKVDQALTFESQQQLEMGNFQTAVVIVGVTLKRRLQLVQVGRRETDRYIYSPLTDIPVRGRILQLPLAPRIVECLDR